MNLDPEEKLLKILEARGLNFENAEAFKNCISQLKAIEQPTKESVKQVLEGYIAEGETLKNLTVDALVMKIEFVLDEIILLVLEIRSWAKKLNKS